MILNQRWLIFILNYLFKIIIVSYLISGAYLYVAVPVIIPSGSSAFCLIWLNRSSNEHPLRKLFQESPRL